MIGFFVTVLTIYLTETFKQAVHARTVAHQLRAQLDVYADSFLQYEALSGIAREADAWHKAREEVMQLYKSSPLAALRERRRVDSEFRKRLDIDQARLRNTFRELVKLRRTPTILQSHISDFEASESDMRTNVTLIPDSEAAVLGPSVAYSVVEFRQCNRDAYTGMVLMLRYIAATKNPTDSEVAEYFGIYFRRRVEAYVAYHALREWTEGTADMTLPRFLWQQL